MKSSPHLMTRLKLTSAVLLLGALPIAAHACNSEPYIGTVCTFAFDWCPAGYLPADGRLLTITSNQALFALIGFRYGGDNVSNFNLPDLRGRATIGKGLGQGLTQNIAIGQKVGQEAVLLSPAQTPLPAHTHTAVFTPTSANVPVTIPGSTGNLSVTAVLPVVPAAGNITGTSVTLGTGQTGYLAGMNGSTAADPVTFSGPYTTASPPANAGKLQAQVQVTGNASTAPATVQVQTVNGGSVAIAQTAAAPTLPVSTQMPSMGMSTCIAATGLYPNRP